MKRSARFPKYFTMNELLKSGLITALFTIVVLVVFVVAYWAFRGFLPGSKVVEQPLPTPNDIDGTTAHFKLYGVKWCPYSAEAKEKMQSFEGIVNQNTYGGKHVVIEFIDCESQKDECSLYKIVAYPTYKLVTSIKMFEYMGPPSTETYRTFLVSALGKEEPIQ